MCVHSGGAGSGQLRRPVVRERRTTQIGEDKVEPGRWDCLTPGQTCILAWDSAYHSPFWGQSRAVVKVTLRQPLRYHERV